MPDAPLLKYPQLSPEAQHLVQLCALHCEPISRTELVKLSSTFGRRDEQGGRLVYAKVKDNLQKLLDEQILVPAHSSRLVVNCQVADYAVQQSIREGQFETIAEFLQRTKPLNGFYYGFGSGHVVSDTRTARDMRIAFYRGDSRKFDEVSRHVKFTLVSDNDSLNVLCPFNTDIFARLDSTLQWRYLREAMPLGISSGYCDPAMVAAFEQFVHSRESLDVEMVSLSLDLAVARGDLAELNRLEMKTSGEFSEIAGCREMLDGHWDRALECFDQAVKRLRGSTKKKKVALEHLPGIFHAALLLREDSPTARSKAVSAINWMRNESSIFFSLSTDALQQAVEFQSHPTAGRLLYAEPLSSDWFGLYQILSAYVWQWLQPEAKPPVSAKPLEKVLVDYERNELHWFAAETAALLGRLPIKKAPAFAEKSQSLHAQLKTVSLVDMIKPVPAWQRSLHALAHLTSAKGSPDLTAATDAHERMIWELDYDGPGHFDLNPLIQKRNKNGGWSDGRPVALKRLYHSLNDPTMFPFLSDADKAICRALCEESSYGWGRYREVYYFFNCAAAAPALVGHPLVFRSGDRANPLELVRREPQLLVTRIGRASINIVLDPLPSDSDEDQVMLVEEGPRRLAYICFAPKHREIAKIIGSSLTIPASAEADVLSTIQSVASLVTIHSEIGGGEATGEVVEADTRPHLHLSPLDDGVRAEFFVQPFGGDGPLYRPGGGGTNVLAEINGLRKSTRRDLAAEIHATLDVVAACPSLHEQCGSDEDSAVVVGSPDSTTVLPHEFQFPTPIEALELMLQLQPLVDDNRVVTHWPQGKAMRVVGQAGSSQFQMSIRRDRDWFAASGALKVDHELTLDMMKLIELVEASPTRFIQLDDGRFLALTEKFRQRIEEIAALSDRRGDKLRFPPIRAAALEDLDQEFKLKTDKHWTECLTRMREATSLVPVVPTTFQGELRDYQRDGYQWLCRLAHWGVGACLADDMGLGKTIEAIALLLDRAAGGPALIVAPTSVAFNWMNELGRFAPTLNPKLFGPGDRDLLVQGLGPRDVVVCSYGLLHNEAELIQTVHWHTVILDEAQAIKNMTTKRSQAAMGLAADFRLIMTGTPLENHLGELWNLFQFINPGLLGSLENFNHRFAAPIERDKNQPTRRRLKKLIQPFILRRTKTQVLEELPSRTEITLQVELSREEAAFYEALRQRAVEKLAESSDAAGGAQHLKILAEIMRLRRACCHPRLAVAGSALPSSKLTLFSETIDELLDNRHKALVFSQFVDHLTILREELDRKKIAYQYLDGSTPMRERQRSVEAFQAGEGDVFLISLKAGGLGLNLTAADYVLHMDPWWNPAVEDQASDRAHRLGQQRPVTIYRFVAKGTIEESIVALHANKRDLADSLLEGADLTGKLSAEQLLALIRQ